MIKRNAMGVVFANLSDEMMHELTEVRSLGSIPFGCRYRIVDFTLSNLVNADISNIGILTKENYRSLMDHIGSGKPWDLDRKHSGIFILPPFSLTGSGMNIGHIDALYGVLDFIKDSKENFVVLYDADVLCNIDINDMLERHISSGADITIAYKNGSLPQNNRDIMAFTFDDSRVDSIRLSDKAGEICDYSLDIMIMERQKLIDLITAATERNYTSLSRHILQPNVDKIKIYGYEVKEYAVVMDSTKTYFKANMDLLDPEVRAQLFNPARPIYTKTRDSMPAKYGLESDVANSLIADGCIIEGTVRNSLIFRNVHIGKGAVVENCIIMQDGDIGDGAELRYVATDKEVSVSAGRTLAGAETYPLIIAKGTNV